MKVLIAGDFCPKFRVSDCLNQKDYSSILGEVVKYTDQNDFSIANFETNISTDGDKSILKYGPSLKTDANAVKALHWAGFNVVTLANNHFYDYGQAGVYRTIETLNDYNISFVGGGRSLEEAKKTLYLKKGLQVVAVINACENEFSIADDKHGGSYPLDIIDLFYRIKEARCNSDFVLVITHSGHELFQLPSLRMQKNFRFLIDVGADAVINHHQHCFSGKETYKNKPIYYGLGNFIFDYSPVCSNIKNEGFLVQLDFGSCVESGEIPYYQCNENVGVHFLKDDSQFRQKFNLLSSIISSDSKLKHELEKYYGSAERSLLARLQPYNSNLLRKLYVKGLFPGLLNKKNLVSLRNMIECESHFDKLIYILKSKTEI